MSPPACIAIVTGANRLNGIGLACVRKLALQYPSSSLNRGPLLIYMTSRSKESGEIALQTVTKQIEEDSGGQRTEADGSPFVTVKLRLLDIESDESIASFTASVVADHPDGIDILINNAGVAVTGDSCLDVETRERTFRLNYFGTYTLTKALLPHVRDGGRIVTLSSFVSQFELLGGHRMYSDEIKNRFLQAEKIEDITAIVNDYKAAIEKGGDWRKDWPPSPYAVSKAAVNGMTKILAKEIAQSGRNILINCCCPGFVQTDMFTGRGSQYDPEPRPVKTPDEGAETPVLLALGDIKGQSGLLWRNEHVLEWK